VVGARRPRVGGRGNGLDRALRGGVGQIGELADPGVEIDLATHLVGRVVVLAAVLVPSLHTWMTPALSRPGAARAGEYLPVCRH